MSLYTIWLPQPVNESVANREPQYPIDWPADGPIDLVVHDLPHESSTTEWWYVNSHIETLSGDKYALFASFFRVVTGRNPETQELEYAHAVIWALSDVANGKYYAESRLDPRAPEIILGILEREKSRGDELVRRAVKEVLDKGQLPHPDTFFQGPVLVAQDRLELDFGGNCYHKLEDGSYQLELYRSDLKLGCNLIFRPLKAPMRHGDNGVVHGFTDEDMFYYFIPRCQVEGTLIVDNESKPLKTSDGWYDHEFGRSRYFETSEPSNPNSNVAWNWVSIQLDNNTEITAYEIIDEHGESIGRWLILIPPSGVQQSFKDFTLTPLDSWTSIRTFNEYPLKWQLDIPEAEISLTFEAPFGEQEFITLISRPAFWEGRVNVAGTMQGQVVNGLGYFERTGFNVAEKLEDFLGAVGQQTRNHAHDLLPLDPTHEQVRRLVASDAHDHYLDNLDIDQFTRTMIKPIREILDRGGKTWRSYALLSCCDVVGGNPNNFTELMVIPELLHVGSLIVDDVQDKSIVRRGGPAAHLIYGESLAINAGTAAYFFGQLLLPGAKLDPATQLRVYDLYFEALRASHAGQALDLDGPNEILPQVVESGDSAPLEQRILVTHRLKSAVPARSLAMMGAILGKGTESQVRALGNFFEGLGLAFQIIDDTLNLRGFEKNLKSKGEDISHGKFTMPVAKAMSRLSLAKRRWLCETVSSKPTDPQIISEVVRTLEACGALDACVEQANQLVEDAWQKLDPLLEDSYVKLMLRAFGWYVLERNY